MDQLIVAALFKQKRNETITLYDLHQVTLESKLRRQQHLS